MISIKRSIKIMCTKNLWFIWSLQKCLGNNRFATEIVKFYNLFIKIKREKNGFQREYFFFNDYSAVKWWKMSEFISKFIWEAHFCSVLTKLKMIPLTSCNKNINNNKKNGKRCHIIKSIKLLRKCINCIHLK